MRATAVTIIVFAMLAVALAVVAGVVIGFVDVLWIAWCDLLPALWPTGPEQIIKPDFWPFLCAWVVLAYLAHYLAPRSPEIDKP